MASDGPLLLGSNHPNSFLDGIILTTLFKRPVHSLARGDVFSNRYINRLLRWLKLLPVYRTSEGVENLNHNYTTFKACQQTFAKKEIVLIFSEGGCENEWHLRPLKKGTARLAITAWKNSIPLKVIPVGINYSSFNSFGKEVHIYFGDPLSYNDLPSDASEGKQLICFNNILHNELAKIVYEIEPDENEKRKKLFHIYLQPSFYIMAIPGLIGFILHAPFYYFCKIIAVIGFRKTVHYDSSLTSLLYFIYPFYLILLFIIVINYSLLAGCLIILIMPFLAYATVQTKYQLGW